MATAEFIFNNKIYTAIKLSLFKINYEQKSRMGFKIRKKRKHAKVEEFVKEIKKMHKEVKTALKILQEEIKKYIDRNRKKVVKYKVGDRVLLSMKDLVWQMRNEEVNRSL